MHANCKCLSQRAQAQVQPARPTTVIHPHKGFVSVESLGIQAYSLIAQKGNAYDAQIAQDSHEIARVSREYTLAMKAIA